MKKKVLAILLASTMTLALGACGSSDDGTSSGDSGETASEDTSGEDTADDSASSEEGGSFEGASIEIDIEDSIQGNKETLDQFLKEIDAFSGNRSCTERR